MAVNALLFVVGVGFDRNSKFLRSFQKTVKPSRILTSCGEAHYQNRGGLYSFELFVN
jgi:hypothetical protein